MIHPSGNPLLYNLTEQQCFACYAVLATKSYTGETLVQVTAETRELALKRADTHLRKYAEENGFDGIYLLDSLF